MGDKRSLVEAKKERGELDHDRAQKQKRNLQIKAADVGQTQEFERSLRSWTFFPLRHKQKRKKSLWETLITVVI